MPPKINMSVLVYSSSMKILSVWLFPQNSAAFPPCVPAK